VSILLETLRSSESSSSCLLFLIESNFLISRETNTGHASALHGPVVALDNDQLSGALSP
jgi:hypothetical protein